MRKKITVAVAVLCSFLLLQAALPQPARADTGDTLVKVAIIGGAVTGGLVLIAIIGTALTRDDPRILLQPESAAPPPAGAMRFGTACPHTPAGALAVCW